MWSYTVELHEDMWSYIVELHEGTRSCIVELHEDMRRSTRTCRVTRRQESHEVLHPG